jgi:glycosyltransferase involved in cell wall biosynthesis
VLSIVVPSVRVGGLDVLCDSLAAQTCTDFELVLADGIHDARAPHVADRLAAQPFPVQHLASGGLPLSNYCRSINDAVVAARGDTILMLPDYTWLAPNTVEKHVRFHEANRGARRSLMIGYEYRFPPALDSRFPGYHPKLIDSAAAFDLHDPAASWEVLTTREAERYSVDLFTGALEPFMWSIFVEPLTADSVAALELEHSHKLFGVEWSYRYCSLKNESFPVEAWLELNGLDEDMDGSHLFQDLAWGERLNRAGWEWEREEGGEITVVNPRSVFSAKRIPRPMRTNETIAQQKLDSGAPVNPGWSLRERRASRG